MDFFGHQDQARKRTRQLVVLFVLALFTLIFLTNLLVAGVLWGNPDIFPELGNKTIRDPSLLDIFHYMSWRSWLTISAIVCGFVGLAYFYKVVKLSGGGASIAETLGGRLLHPDSDDFYEKRLLRVLSTFFMIKMNMKLLDSMFALNSRRTWKPSSKRATV